MDDYVELIIIDDESFLEEYTEPKYQTSRDNIETFSELINDEEELLSTPEFDLTSSFFETEAEVYEDNVAPEIQPLESENLGEIAIPDEETGFVFNEVEGKDPFQMKVVDPATIDPDSQMQLEFDIPLKSKGEAEQTSSVVNELNEDLSQDKKVKNFDETALEIKFNNLA